MKHFHHFSPPPPPPPPPLLLPLPLLPSPPTHSRLSLNIVYLEQRQQKESAD